MAQERGTEKCFTADLVMWMDDHTAATTILPHATGDWLELGGADHRYTSLPGSTGRSSQYGHRVPTGSDVTQRPRRW